MSLLPPLPPVITSFVPVMDWVIIHRVRDAIKSASPVFARKQSAFLFPDGDQVNRRLWVRVPVLRGFRRAACASEMDTDRFIDCCRGGSSAATNLENTVIMIKHFPFDEPVDLVNAFTIVVAPQRNAGPRVYPVNQLITCLMPGRVRPWRGNVLVFKHGTTKSQSIINISEEDLTFVKAIIMRVLCDGLVGGDE
ncbi:hypothetical protein C8J57DRAFT_1505979 [Mycena rebaudengoi]|nr:hypothetical protein C8J57DRAFT_1505979 [Mycena rebaudengoi]